MNFYVIGIDDNQNPEFGKGVLKIISENRIFSGGSRHYDIVKRFLPKDHVWIEIRIPLHEVFVQYGEFRNLVVFASGDPLFFGFANTIAREMPLASMEVFPSFNSLQMLAHRLLIPYQEMQVVSLTGRSWDKLDESLIEGRGLIGVLTDKKCHTPQTVALRLLEYGYTNYRMLVGCLLGNVEKECFGWYELEDVGGLCFDFPNSIILQQTFRRARPMGIADHDFHLLNGRAKMITKMPVRLLSLSLLNLRDCGTLWDIGFCTGSVSVEAKLQFPHLQIIAFEKRPEAEDLLRLNAKKFGTPGLRGVRGDFLELDLSVYPVPDAVFIGGHGGKLGEILSRIVPLLPEGGSVVFNSVSEDSKNRFIAGAVSNGLMMDDCIRIKVDDFNEIDILKAIRK